MNRDRERLADALRRVYFGIEDYPLSPNDLADADAVIEEYDRLTREWQERMRSVMIDPKATPTRRGQVT